MSDKILVTGDFDLPQGVPNERIVHLREPRNNQAIYDLLPGARHYIVGGPEYVDGEMMDRGPNLKHIVVMGTGTNSFVDVKATFDRSIQVDNTPGINADAVAEYALGALITHGANSVHSRETLLVGADWYQKPHKTLNETKIGIVGFGDIGSRFAAKVRAIAPRAEMSYFSRTKKPEKAEPLNASYKSMEDLARNSDVLILSVTYNQASHHIINKDLIAQANQGIKIFNFSNPKTIDPVALRAGLVSGAIRFTYFDGYYCEWVDNKGIKDDPHGLLALGAEKFVATSHIGAQADEVIQNILAVAFQKVEQWKPPTLEHH